MYQMEGIGDGVEDHTRAAEDAGSLTDRARQAVPLADHLERFLAGAVYLCLAAFEDLGHESTISFQA